MNFTTLKNAALMGLLVLGASGAAHAQTAPTLSLSPAQQIVPVGSTVTLDVFLSSAVNAGQYDINIFLPTQVSFVSGAYTDTTFFTNNFGISLNGNDLTISASGIFPGPGGTSVGATFNTPDDLFRFMVTVNSPLPAGGASVFFGPDGPTASGAAGGSVLNNNDTQANELLTASQLQSATLFTPAAVPETSSFVLLGLGLLPLGLLAVRRRAARR